jgi:SAM-dependent methyltransferase
LLILTVLVGIRALAAAEGRSLTNRSEALNALCQRLDIGPGAVIADVGCGDGPDTVIFAAIVGERGTVLAEEIDAAKLKKVVENADKRGYHQVVPVLGQSDDPRLPDGFVNLIYLNRVFHHFARPRSMLERMWCDLKPGGFLVIVDQQNGPLTDWAPMENREKEHHWTGETAVVRLAREAGFLFHDLLDELWHEKQPFVLVFRKPVAPVKSTGDPDLPRPLDAKALLHALPPAWNDGSAVVFVGLDWGRAVVPALKEQLPASTRFFDVIIDEWALSREELPPEATRAGVEVLRTAKGSLTVPADVRVGLVLFVDAYHRLWEPSPLLQRLKEQMRSSGLVAVVDRKGPDAEPRRLAGHRRRLSASLVIEDMRKAGFHLRRTLPAPAKDHFFLLFGVEASPADRKP